MRRQSFVMGITLALMLTGPVMGQGDPSTVLSYQTDTSPTLDGMIMPGEWDAAGPPIVVAPTDGGTAFPADPFGGPSDLSFQFRTMWTSPWTAYFLFEVTDDIAMEEIPGNRWEMDQVEFFMDGNDLEGSSDLESFQWWDHDEPYGKFGASRWEGEFEGNVGVMSTFIDDLYSDGFGATAVAVAKETGEAANYVVEYAVTLEPMFDLGIFDGTSTGAAGQIVPDETAVKFTACVSDNDNFGDGTTGRSHSLCSFREPPEADWRDTTAFATLVFTGPFTASADGDFDGDGDLDVDDIDALTAAVKAGDASFDVNGDGVANALDRTTWVKELKKTWIGDANLDGVFNTTDLIGVFQGGKFEKDEMASWSEGDFDGDMRFGTGDLLVAFQDGGFEQGPVAPAAVRVVPEPSSLLLSLLALFGLIRVARSKG